MGLYERKNYTKPVRFIFNQKITEWDISKANINILLYKGIISEKEFNQLALLSRHERQVYIGYILKDENINQAFEDGLKEIRRLFIEQPGMSEDRILSIKNDAIYVIGDDPHITKFGNVEFIGKNVYTSYIKLFNLEIYYGLNRITCSENIDIKGINNSKIPLHQEYMIDIICNVLYQINTGDIQNAIGYLKNMYNDYINKSLPIGFYRTFDNMSLYNIIINARKYALNHLNYTAENYEILDISYNANILRELNATLMDYVYNSIRRGV